MALSTALFGTRSAAPREEWCWMIMLTRCWLFCGASFLKSFLTSFFRILNAECIQVVLLGSMSKKERKNGKRFQTRSKAEVTPGFEGGWGLPALVVWDGMSQKIRGQGLGVQVLFLNRFTYQSKAAAICSTVCICLHRSGGTDALLLTGPTINTHLWESRAAWHGAGAALGPRGRQ